MTRTLHHPLSLWSNRALKRTVDLVVSIAALLILTPVMLVIAILIKLDSPGPALYRQVRIGKDGRPFGMLKFRTMRANAERRTGPVWAKRNDPRITRAGKLLRHTDLDELPQLFNVLVGDMSLVGPRPERLHFVREFLKNVPRYIERHDVLPGLTGWAQVNGLRGNTSVRRRTKFDLSYIKHWSLWLDLRIIVRTCVTILR